MWRKWLHNNWKRWLIIITCLGLVTVRLIWPQIQFDAVTIWLIVIAAFFLIIPEPRVFFPYIKRVKLWEAEIELKEEIKELGREVDKAQESVDKNPELEVAENLTPEVEEVLRQASKDPRAAFLLLSAKIDHFVRKRLEEAGLNQGNRVVSAPRAIKMGVEAGLFPKEVESSFNDFWAVRNKVAHDAAFDVDDKTILALISLGTVILTLLSTEKRTSQNVKV
jgi:hypothetical protein